MTLPAQIAETPARVSISCPGCLSKVSVSREKLPPAGAWAICPICRDRFFIPGLDLNEVLGDPAPAATAATAAKPRTAPRRTGPHDRTFVVEEREGGHVIDDLVAEPPKRVLGPKLAYGLAAAAMIGLVVALALVYGGASGAGVVDLPPAPAEVQVIEYGFPQVQADLLYLRRKLASRDHYDKVVEYRGVESRLFKHLQAELSPGTCPDIVSLRMRSDAPRKGVSIKADCLAAGEKGATLDVSFLGGWAVVVSRETGLRLDVPVLTSAKKAWERGERRYREPGA